MIGKEMEQVIYGSYDAVVTISVNFGRERENPACLPGFNS
jgi:hypothetical protein